TLKLLPLEKGKHELPQRKGKEKGKVVMGEGSHPATKRKKTIDRKDGHAVSRATSSPKPLRTINLTDPFGTVAETTELREDHSPHVSSHRLANRSVHTYYDTHEESNALTNATALERAWFSLARRALAQTDILKRFERLQADFDQLAETHSECGETVGKLVQARMDLAHSSHFIPPYPIGIRESKALWIKELEDELARKDSALVYAERLNAERTQEREKLVTQLSKKKMKKFECVRKLLPTVVERLLQSYEYKQSMYEPFNQAIQAGWGKGLSEERSKEDHLEHMSRMENFDAYVDKKMCVECDKLFEKRYPYVEKISCGFCYPVSDLVKVYPDSPPSVQASPS
nr:hypothetical protein [Tanacetum cinerariifolium]